MSKDFWEEVREVANNRQLTNTQLYNKAIDTYGHAAQTGQALQEMCELMIELEKFIFSPKRWDIDRVAEEMADVYVMLEQVKIIMERIDKDYIRRVLEHKNYKNARLEKRLMDVKVANYID